LRGDGLLLVGFGFLALDGFAGLRGQRLAFGVRGPHRLPGADDDAEQQCGGDGDACGKRHLVPAKRFL